MTSRDSYSNLVNLIIIIVICVLVFLSLPAHKSRTVGLFLPSSIHQHFVPYKASQVSVFDGARPQHYINLGRINLERHYDPKTVDPQLEERIISAAVKRAAKIGANGLIINVFGHTRGQATALNLYELQATAVRVLK